MSIIILSWVLKFKGIYVVKKGHITGADQSIYRTSKRQKQNLVTAIWTGFKPDVVCAQTLIKSVVQ